MNPKEILFLDPVCTHNIWGGNRLREEFGYQEKGDDIGECWGISAHSDGDGSIRCGTLRGQKLSWVWKNHPELFGNLKFDEMPVMTKIIDAREDLSIQVHPDDSYAAVHENGALGKTESWYIIDCEDGATLVLGHNAKTRSELTDMICEGRWKDLLCEYPVKKGDFIQIDPGTVHAIKGGILLLELQQSSNITYRLYDYDRCRGGKRRELHLEKSIDVITVPGKVTGDKAFSTIGYSKNQLNEIYNCCYYKVFLLDVCGRVDFIQQYPFLMMSVTEGEGTVDGKLIKRGDHFILPDGYGEVVVEGDVRMVGGTVEEVLLK